MGQAVTRFVGSDLFAKIGKLVFTVTVYSIWEERNKRIFTGNNRREEVLVKEIGNYIAAKAHCWTVKRTFRNWVICNRWGLVERILIVCVFLLSV